MKVRFSFCDKDDYDLLYFDPEYYSLAKEQNNSDPHIRCPIDVMRFIILYSIDNPNNENEFILCVRAKTYESLYGTMYLKFTFVKSENALYLEDHTNLPNDYIGLPHKELPYREKPHQLFMSLPTKSLGKNIDEAIIYSTYLCGIDYDSNIFSLSRFL